MGIHPTAIIDPTAEIGNGVEVGPYSIIGPHCRVGDGSKIAAHAVLQEYVHLGANCQVSSGAVLGGAPQDLKFKGEPSYVVIGDGSVLRECVTVNRSSGEGEKTIIGQKSLLMAYSHVAHNCILGDEVIMANSVQLGGHVEVGDCAFLGGIVAVHQFVKIGRLAIISGFGATRQDIPPFGMADGRPAVIAGINKVGLKRRGVDLAGRTRLKKAFHLLWFSTLNQEQALDAIRNEIEMDANIQELLSFVEASTRGFHRPRNHKRSNLENGNEEHPVEDLMQCM